MQTTWDGLESVNTSRRPVIRGPLQQASGIRGAVLACVFLTLVIDGLTAYSFFGVPVPWFAYCVAAAGLACLLGSSRISCPPGSFLLLALVGYALLVHCVSLAHIAHIPLPLRMTTSYALFITSRFAVLIGCLLVSTLVYTASMKYGVRAMIDTIVAAMVSLAIAALLLYAAQVLGYWEPPRNRMGTGGQDYLSTTVVFQYQFHRATGTFREPSHLAQWLAAPFIFLFVCRGRTATILWVIVGTVVLLTGSLLGVLGLFVGLSCVAFFLRGSIAWRMFLLILLVSGIVGALGHFLSIDFWGAIVPRLTALVEGGAESTNRAYVYEYLRAERPPALGFGLGNANLMFSEYLGNELVSSHISLFVNTWFSLGMVGLALISLYVAYPLISLRVWRSAAKSSQSAVLLAGIVTWLVMYLGHAEELTVMFAAVYGLTWAEVNNNRAAVRGDARFRSEAVNPAGLARDHTSRNADSHRYRRYDKLPNRT